tara:strand:- start:500 stop:1915 length:1416 start_codon:yes stop_codon:yes gene_type:complete
MSNQYSDLDNYHFPYLQTYDDGGATQQNPSFRHHYPPPLFRYNSDDWMGSLKSEENIDDSNGDDEDYTDSIYADDDDIDSKYDATQFDEEEEEARYVTIDGKDKLLTKREFERFFGYSQGIRLWKQARRLDDEEASSLDDEEASSLGDEEEDYSSAMMANAAAAISDIDSDEDIYRGDEIIIFVGAHGLPVNQLQDRLDRPINFELPDNVSAYYLIPDGFYGPANLLYAEPNMRRLLNDSIFTILLKYPDGQYTETAPNLKLSFIPQHGEFLFINFYNRNTNKLEGAWYNDVSWLRDEKEDITLEEIANIAANNYPNANIKIVVLACRMETGRLPGTSGRRRLNLNPQNQTGQDQSVDPDVFFKMQSNVAPATQFMSSEEKYEQMVNHNYIAPGKYTEDQIESLWSNYLKNKVYERSNFFNRRGGKKKKVKKKKTRNKKKKKKVKKKKTRNKKNKKKVKKKKTRNKKKTKK